MYLYNFLNLNTVSEYTGQKVIALIIFKTRKPYTLFQIL